MAARPTPSARSCGDETAPYCRLAKSAMSRSTGCSEARIASSGATTPCPTPCMDGRVDGWGARGARIVWRDDHVGVTDRLAGEPVESGAVPIVEETRKLEPVGEGIGADGKRLQEM